MAAGLRVEGVAPYVEAPAGVHANKLHSEVRCLRMLAIREA